MRALKFDPNLAAADSDDDASMADDSDVDDDAMDDDDDAGYADDFSDDEDHSWKVRRAAAGLFVELVRANPDAVPQLYGARPALAKRFKEREESVKLDVFNAVRACPARCASVGCSAHFWQTIEAVLCAACPAAHSTCSPLVLQHRSARMAHDSAMSHASCRAALSQ